MSTSDHYGSVEAGALVVRSDARCLPLADNSVDLIVTSPPYFALRSYTDGGEHYDGQIGAEASPAEFVAALVDCTREWLRVLKPSGSLWVNLGDKYAQRSSGVHSSSTAQVTSRTPARRPIPYKVAREGQQGGIREKSLLGLPWRYALACMDDLGLILRAEVVWSKPNGLPESVTDRVRRSHEQWFHFTAEPRYYSAVDAVREPHLTPGVGGPRRHDGAAFAATGKTGSGDGTRHTDGHELGKLPGSVWTVPTAPLKVPDHIGVEHFAAYPPDLVRTIILGWSPASVCTACGEGRRPVAERLTATGKDRGGPNARHQPGYREVDRADWQEGVRRTITGEACSCPDTSAPSRPGVVLDPFGGTGTTALVASCHGRRGISVDLSQDYSRLARWRTTDPGERARVLKVDKPVQQIDGQGDLFAGAVA